MGALHCCAEDVSREGAIDPGLCVEPQKTCADLSPDVVFQAPEVADGLKGMAAQHAHHLTLRELEVLRESRLPTKSAVEVWTPVALTWEPKATTSVPYRVCSLTTVGSFVRSTRGQGRQCHFFGQTPARKTAKCHLDMDSQSLVVSSVQGPVQSGTICAVETLEKVALAEVEDIFTVEEDGEAAFPPEVLSSVAPEERERLLLVMHRTPQGLSKLCFLEESVARSHEFKEGLGVMVASSLFVPKTLETASPPPSSS